MIPKSNKTSDLSVANSKSNSTLVAKPRRVKVQNLNLFGLLFAFDKGKLIPIEQNLSVTDIINLCRSVITVFKSVNDQGFVSYTTKQNPMFLKIKNFIEDLGFKTNDNSYGSNVNSFTLWFNFLIFNLSIIAQTKLSNVECPLIEEDLDNITDLDNLNTTLLSYLDPYLKLQIQKRGITIIQNTYTGFDTEYTLIDSKKYLNRLISVQTSIQTRTIVKIPRYSTLDISFAHPLTSETTTFFKPIVQDWDLSDEQNQTLESKESVKTKKKRRGRAKQIDTVYELSLINESLKYCVDQFRLLKLSTIKKMHEDLI